MKKTMTADGEWNTGYSGKTDPGYYTLAYSGSLGGGTLRIYSTIDEIKTPVPNSKLSAATVDDAGDVVQQVIFSTSGTISVALSGATAPNVTIVVA